MKHGAKVSFIIPVFNEEHHLPGCLNSISAQTYPHDRIEVVVADGGSADRTLELAEKWASEQSILMKRVDNPRRIAEFGKAEALKVSDGDFIVLLDADNRLCDPDWLSKALRAFDLFPDMFGFESCYLPVPNGTALNHYLTVCLHISDPLAWGAATHPVEIELKEDCGMRYRKYRIPPGYPCGANGFVYRRSVIEPYIGLETFEEAVVPMDIAVRSDAFIAAADGVGVQHYYVGSIRDFLRKRAKIALKSHTRQQERKTWIAYTGGRMIWAGLLQITFVWPFIYSLWKTFKTKDRCWLLHAPVCFLTSTVYFLHWVRIKLRKEKAW
ncbi:MAG: glycosyltransferase [Kiritimatiellales bacterium]|nr:glycosyltransferase [Kiritimatiellota bacterium]MBL7011627.1 glycosyltransferase [Kiritimatiellales bacterium]